MGEEERNLVLKSQANTLLILELIAAGHTYEQIVARHPLLTYLDIFTAAREALAIVRQHCPVAGDDTPPADKVAQVRARHPRAYLPWDAEEDATVLRMAHDGETVGAIAEYLHRQPGAIRSRLRKLGLMDENGAILP